MDKYIRKIIEYICKYYNYSLTEFISDSNINFWAAEGIINDTTRNIFIFSDEKNIEFSQNAIDNLLKAYPNKYETNTKIIKVLVLKNYDNMFDISKYDTSNLVIINSRKNEITFASEEIKYDLEQLKNILKIMKQNDVSKKVSKVTNGIILINIVVFLISAILSKNLFNIDIGVLDLLGAKDNLLINQGQIYRLFTCMFLHAGIIHIALNMYALYNIGPLVEEFYGWKKYIFIYLASGIISSIFSYLFSSALSIGASGAIFGVLGAVLVIAYKLKDKIGKNFLKNVISVIIANVIISVTIPNIDIYAHAGGLLFGTIIAWVLYKEN